MTLSVTYAIKSPLLLQSVRPCGITLDFFKGGITTLYSCILIFYVVRNDFFHCCFDFTDPHCTLHVPL